MQSAANPARFMMLVMKLAFVVSGLLFIFVVARVPTQAQQPVSPAFEWVIALMAITDDVMGLYGRRLFGWFARRVPQREEASTPLRLWMTANVFSLALMESCILFGMVLHFAGARARFVELLFAVGMISLILWSPGTPPAADKGTPLQS